MTPRANKLQQLIAQFQKVANRLDEILRVEVNDIVRDSAVKRFELAFDLSWKTVKAYLEDEGITCYSPKNCFREAFRQGLLQHDDFWIHMVDMRNETTHTYNELVAEKIFKELPEALKHFQHLLENLRIKGSQS